MLDQIKFTAEVCCASVESIEVACSNRIQRIELCQNLEEGGVTPSPGLFKYAVDRGLNVHVLIRPRVGGFIYNAYEKEVILNDVQYFISKGAKGIVLGTLNEQLALDTEFLEKLKDYTSDIELTFHRAFDELVDWKKAIDLLVGLGFKRILTSGRSKNIALALDNFTEILKYAESKIEIMPGGGINSENVQDLIKKLPISSVHFSGTKKVFLDESSLFSSSLLMVDEKKVQRILSSISLTLQKR